MDTCEFRIVGVATGGPLIRRLPRSDRHQALIPVRAGGEDFTCQRTMRTEADLIRDLKKLERGRALVVSGNLDTRAMPGAAAREALVVPFVRHITWGKLVPELELPIDETSFIIEGTVATDPVPRANRGRFETEIVVRAGIKTVPVHLVASNERQLAKQLEDVTAGAVVQIFGSLRTRTLGSIGLSIVVPTTHRIQVAERVHVRLDAGLKAPPEADDAESSAAPPPQPLSIAAVIAAA